jgi:hypothetical protein
VCLELFGSVFFALTPQLQVKHHECQQDVAVYDGGASVALMFNSSIKNV